MNNNQNLVLIGDKQYELSSPTSNEYKKLMIQSFGDEYINKEEDLQKLFKSHGFMKESRSMTAFEKFMRARIRRSSAVTPITNISDMSRVSDDVFQFLNSST